MYLSFDCAYKSLAWSYIDVKSADELAAIKKDIVECTQLLIVADAKQCKILRERLIKIKQSMDNFVTFKSQGVIDLIPGLKTDCDPVLRTQRLAAFLNTIEISDDTIILIERQPNKIGSKANNKSTMVEHQIMYHYVNKPMNNIIAVGGGVNGGSSTREVHLVSPHLKNKLKFGGRAITDYNTDKYRARKKHSKDMFLDLIKLTNNEHVIKGIRSKNLDDLADSALQAVAFEYLSD